MDQSSPLAHSRLAESCDVPWLFTPSVTLDSPGSANRRLVEPR